MLKLKKVQILGFKSFCDRTEVQLAGSGIAAIVGPNGCGKSNISDAITWVLGEQSAKSLRGIKMEDVIFAGTRERKPTGMAEVSLTLVDPEIYDSQSSDPDHADSEAPTPISTDWNETELRQQHAAETEEAVTEAQPGTIIETEADPTPDSQNVVLKIRRRKFGRAPIRAGELTVTRRLFRSGDSEYLLNGKICRLRDIQDIFMGTGLGGESYAIIGQERIGQLLSSKPADRRGIIEEAAGITRFKTKKRLAELRLESARQNLSRVNDIFEEVTKQMGILKRQAAKAERYAAIRDELRTRLRVVVASRLAQLDTDQAHATTSIATLGQTIDTQATLLSEMDTKHSEGVRHGYTLDGQIRETNTAANQSAVELERITARIAANTDRVAELTTRLAQGADDLAAARAQLAHLAGDLEQHRAFAETANAESGASRAEAQRLQQLAQEGVRALTLAEQQAEQHRRDLLALVQRIAQTRNEETQAAAALAGLDREAERLLTESDRARQELATLGLERGQVKLTFEDVTTRLKRLEAELTDHRTQLDQARQQEAASRRKGDQLRGEQATLNGRRNALESLIREHSYSTETVRNIFRAHATRAKQNPQAPTAAPIGTLADYLEADAQHEKLIDNFLRDELNYIVVRTWQDADASIQLLQKEVTGHATFLVAQPETPGAAGQTASPSDLRIQADNITPLQDHIRITAPPNTPNFATTLAALLPKLQNGYLVPDAQAACTLALQHPECFFLPPSGEVFQAHTVTGGRPSAQGPLALKRELAEIQTKLEATKTSLAETERDTLTHQHQIADLNKQIENRNHDRREAERESANSGAALRQLEAEVARLERRLQEWSITQDRNKDARTQKAHLIESRRSAAESLEQDRTTLELKLADLQAKLADLRSEREHLQQAASAASAALAGLEERRRNAAANLEQTTRLYTGQQQRIAQLDTQLTTAAQEKQRREEESAILSTQHIALAETRATAQAESTRLTAEAAALRADTAQLDAQLRALRTETESLRESRAQHTARAARRAADIEHLEATSLNDLNLPAADLRSDSTIPRISGDTLAFEESESRALKQKLEAMGPVNMMALEEYTETAQRHAFLETQRKDLLDAIEDTRDSIKEIDDVSRIKFDEAFKVINDNFSITFTKLFGGGQAHMRLTEPENPAESGIDIIASPPGKKLQNILLLSGGEKALTALSLLVGIFQFQPAPFCVLDEVDAPLDETNVGRFAKLIAEMSATTQFVVITHSKRTMSQADLIYGVTMQEPGVSKIVSVNLGQTNRTQQDNSRRVA